MKMIYHSPANKTHFHKKGCAPSLILKVKVCGTRKWPFGFSTNYPIVIYSLGSDLALIVIASFPIL